MSIQRNAKRRVTLVPFSMVGGMSSDEIVGERRVVRENNRGGGLPAGEEI